MKTVFRGWSLVSSETARPNWTTFPWSTTCKHLNWATLKKGPYHQYLNGATPIPCHSNALAPLLQLSPTIIMNFFLCTHLLHFTYKFSTREKLKAKWHQILESETICFFGTNDTYTFKTDTYSHKPIEFDIIFRKISLWFRISAFIYNVNASHSFQKSRAFHPLPHTLNPSYPRG